jgi:hypothetical protein
MTLRRIAWSLMVVGAIAIVTTFSVEFSTD